MSSNGFINNNVERIIKKFDSRDPFDICAGMGIRIRYKDLGTALKAYYFYQSRIKNIVINARSSRAVRRMLCAHELGHAVLHGELAAMRGFQEIELFDMSIPTEYEANMFAAELIISDEDLMELLNEQDKSFFSIAKELSVPAELLDFKFRIMNNKGSCIESPYTAQADFLKKDIPCCFNCTMQ